MHSEQIIMATAVDHTVYRPVYSQHGYQLVYWVIIKSDQLSELMMKIQKLFCHLICSNGKVTGREQSIVLCVCVSVLTLYRWSLWTLPRKHCMQRTQVGSAAHSLATQRQTGYQTVFIWALAGGCLGRWVGGVGFGVLSMSLKVWVCFDSNMS